MEIEEGFRESVELFLRAVDKDGNRLQMKSFVVSSRGRRFEHYFAEDVQRTDLRSVSKVALALTIGAAIDQGITLGGAPLTPKTDVGVLLGTLARTREMERASAWRGVTIEHLLSNTIGHEEGFFFRKDIAGLNVEEYLPYILRKPLTHSPGTHFSYSNVGSFVASVLFQEFLGRTFADLADELVFSKLGITDYSWKKYGNYDAGCSGLEVSPNDLHKLGELVAQGGVYEDNRVVSESWCASMHTIYIKTPRMYDPARVFPKYGYGFGLWICRDLTYYCDGTNGQYLIVAPRRDLVITTLGDQADMKPITRCMVPILR